MSIAYNGMPIGVTASSKIILLTNIIFVYILLSYISTITNSGKTFYPIPYGPQNAEDDLIIRCYKISSHLSCISCVILSKAAALGARYPPRDIPMIVTSFNLK